MRRVRKRRTEALGTHQIFVGLPLLGKSQCQLSLEGLVPRLVVDFSSGLRGHRESARKGAVFGRAWLRPTVRVTVAFADYFASSQLLLSSCRLLHPHQILRPMPTRRSSQRTLPPLLKAKTQPWTRRPTNRQRKPGRTFPKISCRSAQTKF